MRKLLVVFFVLVFGLSLSIGYSVLILGKQRTLMSVNVLGGRLIELVLPVEIFAQDLAYGKTFLNNDYFDTEAGLFESSYPKLDYTEVSAPMFIPTNGIVGHKDFLYLPDTHPGIDIWTNLKGTGLDGRRHGYPVYSACTGTVVHYKPSNEELEINCDPLPEYYSKYVPSLKVKILYSHLGDGETGESFHELRIGQKLKKGQFIGYQGNRSSFVPENRVVHLHFGVYDLSAKKSPAPPLDPMYYIGVDTHTVGQIFSIDNNSL